MSQANLICLHTCLSNNANMSRASTHKTKLKKVQSRQKRALRIIFNQSKTSPSEPLFLWLYVLNVYQINIFQSAQFMRKIKNKNVPHIFLKLLGVPCMPCLSTNFSLKNFLVPRTFLKTTRFAISAWRPLLWNNCLSKNDKGINNISLFKKGIKKK